MTLTAALFLLPAAHAQSLDLLGTCPGPVSVSVAGMSPNGSYALVSSSGTGSAVVPAGGCAGTVLGVSDVGLALQTVRVADATGADALSAPVPAGGCGKALQVLDLRTCTPSNVYFTARPAQAGTIAGVQQQAFALYDVVELSGVVLATDPYGVWIQEGPSAAWSGVYVYLDAAWDLTWGPIARGDVIDVRGEYAEYFGLTEINLPNSAARSLSVIGYANEPAPALRTVAQLVADPEPWEGVAVRVENVTVASLPDAFGVWSVSSGANTIQVDDQVFDASAGLTVGQRLQWVQGPLSYAFGTYRILPRDAADLR